MKASNYYIPKLVLIPTLGLEGGSVGLKNLHLNQEVIFSN